LPQLVEQPRVLDGDHGLGGEILDQLDLLVGERAHLLTIDGDNTDELLLLQHRHSGYRADASDVSTRDHQWVAVEVASRFTHVGYLDRFPGLGDAAQRGVRSRTEQSSAPQLPQVGRRQRTVECSEAESISFAKPHCPVTGSAKLCCVR
jgi:hypothetical protein